MRVEPEITSTSQDVNSKISIVFDLAGFVTSAPPWLLRVFASAGAANVRVLPLALIPSTKKGFTPLTMDGSCGHIV